MRKLIYSRQTERENRDRDREKEGRERKGGKKREKRGWSKYDQAVSNQMLLSKIKNVSTCDAILVS